MSAAGSGVLRRELGGQMSRKLVKVAVCLGVVLGALAVEAPAFAAGPDATIATSTVVTTTKPTVTSGRAAIFHAQVSPSKVGKTRITGTVTWTVTGTGGTTVPCTATALTVNGKALCRVELGQFLAANSTYTVTATYSGDANFESSSGSAVETVTTATTTLRLNVPKPSSGSPTTITALVISGGGTSAITGSVTFSIVAGSSTKGVAALCAGPNPNARANNTVPLTGNSATCSLPAGWIVVPSPTNIDKRPATKWSVAAVYNGNASFFSVARVIKGIIRS
jgi:hypothetical protein